MFIKQFGRGIESWKSQCERWMDAMQQMNAEKLELRWITHRKSQQLGKLDHQLVQAHLDCNNLLMEYTKLYNAKRLCNAYRKNIRKGQ